MNAQRIDEAVIKSISIDAMLMQRNDVVARLTQAHTLLKEANVILKAASSKYKTPNYHRQNEINLNIGGYGSRQDFLDSKGRGLAYTIASIDAWYWSMLLSESGLRTFMDKETRSKWDNTIAERKVPELTRDNIEETFLALHQKRQEMFNQGVVSLYRSLSWDYKTNKPVAFGKRLILTNMLNNWMSNEQWWLDYEKGHHLEDLVRVMSILDGKPEPDHRDGLAEQMRGAPWNGGHFQYKDYFKMRGFKNGNIHLTFLREDLVEKMNLILADEYPNALPHHR